MARRFGLHRMAWTLVLGGSLGCDDGATNQAPAAAADPRPEAVDPAILAALPPGATAEMYAEGRQLYTPCLVCHGREAEGTALGPALNDGEWIHIEGGVEEIEALVRSGVPSPRQYPIPMPPMGGADLDERQLRSLATYIHTLARGAR